MSKDKQKPTPKRISEQSIATLGEIFPGFAEWYHQNHDEQGNYIGKPIPSLKPASDERKPTPGLIVHFVDETPGDYHEHAHLPALIQHVYVNESDKGSVHLHVFEPYPQDNNAVDAYYSENKEPGTWHYIEEEKA